MNNLLLDLLMILTFILFNFFIDIAIACKMQPIFFIETIKKVSCLIMPIWIVFITASIFVKLFLPKL